MDPGRSGFRDETACGAAGGFAPARRSGFNLLEVLVAMAIFAIGFAMIAGIVPAGHLLNRRTEDDVLAIIASKNVVAVVEAKKIFTPAWEHTYTHDQINEGAYPAGSLSAPGTPQDLQASARGGEAKSLKARCSISATAPMSISRLAPSIGAPMTAIAFPTGKTVW